MIIIDNDDDFSLDGVIKSLEELAEVLNSYLTELPKLPEKEYTECKENAKRYTQLAKWLKDYKRSLERPQGKWGMWVISEIRCPNCLVYFDPENYSKEELNKCPCCGAKIGGTT